MFIINLGGESVRIKKLTLLLFSFVALNGCIESTAALLGPAISVGTSGNVYQASISYTTNQILYNATGKNTIEHVTSFLDPQDEFGGNLNLILKDNVEDVKEVLKKPNKKLALKAEKKIETVSDPILEDQFILF